MKIISITFYFNINYPITCCDTIAVKLDDDPVQTNQKEKFANIISDNITKNPIFLIWLIWSNLFVLVTFTQVIEMLSILRDAVFCD